MALGLEMLINYVISPIVAVVTAIIGFFMRRTIQRLDKMERMLQMSREEIRVLQENYREILRHIESSSRKLDRIEEKTDRKLDSLRDLLVKDLLERRNGKRS